MSVESCGCYYIGSGNYIYSSGVFPRDLITSSEGDRPTRYGMAIKMALGWLVRKFKAATIWTKDSSNR